MKNIQNNPQDNVVKKSEIIWIHANAIIGKNIADFNEVNKWMDALCMSEEITKTVLWEEIYKAIKPQLQITKEFLDPNDKEKIKTLPEFQNFLQQYTHDKEKKQIYDAQKNEIDYKKAALENISIPDDIQKTKEKIDNIKKIIREIISEKEEKNEWSRKTFESFIKNSILSEEEKKEKIEKIYDFIFDYIENSTKKKQRKIWEKSNNFYKRIGIEYMVSGIRKAIEEQENKVKQKINSRKENTKAKLKLPKQEIQKQKDYTNEALEQFCKDINTNITIKNKFYLPEDNIDIQHIQNYFTKNIETTIDSPNMNKLTKDYEIPLHTIKKEGKNIKIHPRDYIEIERRKLEYKKRFIDGDWNAREYLFDRLVEYIGKDILAYKIKNTISKDKKYKGTEFTIEKTDPLDDTSAWADFIVTYSIPWKQKKRIAAVDLFISDKSWGIDMEEENEDQRKKKNEGAKIGKIPYSTYINLFPNKKEDIYTMQPLQRYVDQQSPTLIYTVVAEILRNQKTNIDEFLKKIETRWQLYTAIQNTLDNETKSIEKQFNQNILNELEKIAA